MNHDITEHAVKDPALIVCGLASIFFLEFFVFWGCSACLSQLSLQSQVVGQFFSCETIASHAALLNTLLVVGHFMGLTLGSLLPMEKIRITLVKTGTFILFACVALFCIGLGISNKTEDAVWLILGGSVLVGVLSGAQLRTWTRILMHYDYQVISKLSLIALMCSAPIYPYVAQFTPELMVLLLAVFIFLGLYAFLSSDKKEGECAQGTVSDKSSFMMARLIKGRILSFVAVFVAFALLNRWQQTLDYDYQNVLNLVSGVLLALEGALIYRVCFSVNLLRFSPTRLFRLVFPVLATLSLIMHFLENTSGSILCVLISTLTFTIIALMPSTSIALARKIQGSALGIYVVIASLSYGSVALISLFLFVLPISGHQATSLFVLYFLALALYLLTRNTSSFREQRSLSEPQQQLIGTISQFPEGQRVIEVIKPCSQDEKVHLNQERFAQRTTNIYGTIKKTYFLTERETEILPLLVKGYSVSTIAQLLSVSENTIKTHSKNIYVKLDVHKREELIFLIDSMYDMPSETSHHEG